MPHETSAPAPVRVTAEQAQRQLYHATGDHDWAALLAALPPQRQFVPGRFDPTPAVAGDTSR